MILLLSTLIKIEEPKHKPTSLEITQNGGLGDSYSVISKKIGEPSRLYRKQNGFDSLVYLNDLVLIDYKNGRVSSINFQLAIKNKSLPEKQALEFAKDSMPADAKLIKKVDIDKFDRYYIFQSKTLESLFDENLFNDKSWNGITHKGEFKIKLFHDGDSVASMTIYIGER